MKLVNKLLNLIESWSKEDVEDTSGRKRSVHYKSVEGKELSIVIDADGKPVSIGIRAGSKGTDKILFSAHREATGKKRTQKMPSEVKDFKSAEKFLMSKLSNMHEDKATMKELTMGVRSANTRKEIEAMLKKIDDYAYADKISFKVARGYSEQLYNKLDKLED